MHDCDKVLTTFLNNRFIGVSKAQLLMGLYHIGYLKNPEISDILNISADKLMSDPYQM